MMMANSNNRTHEPKQSSHVHSRPHPQNSKTSKQLITLEIDTGEVRAATKHALELRPHFSTLAARRSFQ